MFIPPRRQGIAELFASAVLFAAMAYVTKKATHTFHAGQIACFRFVVGALLVLAQSRIRQVPLVVVRRDLLAVRGLLGGIAVLIYFVGIERLPVGTATLFNYTSPVFTSLFSWLLLGENLPLGSIGAMGIALVGVVMVVAGQGHALGGAYQWQILALSSAVISAVSAASAGVISQVTVVTALALGHFLDGEPLSMLACIGAALTILGVSVAATR